MLKWLGLIVAATAGLAVGLGGYTFVAAQGSSYLTDDPAACGNCHVMGAHLAAWQRSSHRAVAVCNDCHAPHDGFLRKYAVKAENGFVHSINFTTGRHPDPLRIRAGNRRVTQAACLHCHGDLASTINPLGTTSGHAGERSAQIDCIACHADVGHWVR